MIKQKVFRKSLIIVLLITSIPTILVGSFTYFMGRNQIENEMKHTHAILLEKSASRIEDRLARIELAVTQWSMDSIFETEKMLQLNLKTDYMEIYKLNRFLMVMRNTIPLIDKIEIYVADRAATINDTDGIVYIGEKQNQYLQTLIASNNSLFWVDNYTAQPTSKESTIALFHDLPGTYGDTYGALIVHINSMAFKKMVDDMNVDEENGTSLITRNDGTVVTTGVSKSDMILENALLEHLTENNMRALKFHYDGHTYSVSTRPFDRANLSWSYVTATSMENMTKPIDMMSKLIVSISLAGLLMAGLLSWFASYRLYQPIRRLFGLITARNSVSETFEGRDEISEIEHQWSYLSRESRVLQEKLEKNLPALKEAFLLQLMQGHLIHFKERDIENRMIHFDWEPADSQYLLAVIQVQGFSQNISSFTEGDEPLAAFAALNIMKEMTEGCRERIGIVNFHDMTVGVLFAYPIAAPVEKVKSEFMVIIKECVNGLGSLLKLQVTATVGNRTQSLKELHYAYQSARQSLQYRELHKSNQILDMEELLPRKEAEAKYPFETEKEALQAIRMGLMNESMALADQFYEELVQCSVNEQEVRNGMQLFLGSIHHTILESGYNPTRTLGNGMSVADLLPNTNDPVKLPVQIKEYIIQPHCERVMMDRDKHLKQLVDSTIALLNGSPCKSISLEQCAERAGTTPYTLSRAFKQLLGTNFIDYVTELKLALAKKLLQDTDLKVQEIAEQVGYQPSYLIRQFKKSTGMTPGQYREQHND